MYDREGGVIHRYVQNTIVSLVALMIGVLIYFFARSEQLLVYDWIPGFSLIANSMKGAASDSGSLQFLTNQTWFVYSLPDGLWLFSFTLIAMTIWQNVRKRIKGIVAISVLLFALIHEIGQLADWFRGTFDLIDVITYFIFWCIATIYIKIQGDVK